MVREMSKLSSDMLASSGLLAADPHGGALDLDADVLSLRDRKTSEGAQLWASRGSEHTILSHHSADGPGRRLARVLRPRALYVYKKP